MISSRTHAHVRIPRFPCNQVTEPPNPFTRLANSSYFCGYTRLLDVTADEARRAGSRLHPPPFPLIARVRPHHVIGVALSARATSRAESRATAFHPHRVRVNENDMRTFERAGACLAMDRRRFVISSTVVRDGWSRDAIAAAGAAAGACRRSSRSEVSTEGWGISWMS